MSGCIENEERTTYMHRVFDPTLFFVIEVKGDSL